MTALNDLCFSIFNLVEEIERINSVCSIGTSNDKFDNDPIEIKLQYLSSQLSNLSKLSIANLDNALFISEYVYNQETFMTIIFNLSDLLLNYESKTSIKLLVPPITKLLANLSSNGFDVIKILWSNETIMNKLLLNSIILSNSLKSKICLSAITCFMYNFVRLFDFKIIQSAIFKQLFLSINSTTDNESVIEWIVIMITNLIDKNLILDLFLYVGSDNFLGFTYEQVMLIQMYILVIEDSNKINPSSLTSLMFHLSKSLVNLPLPIHIANDESITENSLLFASINIVIESISITLAKFSEYNDKNMNICDDSIQSSNENSTIFEMLLQNDKNMITWINDYVTIYKKEIDLLFDKNTKLDELNNLEYHNSIYTNMIQLLCNITYNCQLAQDKIQEIGLLDKVLSFSYSSITNPLIKNWITLFIRNICDNNIKNQKHIYDNNISKIDLFNDQMKNIGIPVYIDKNSNKLIFK